MGIRHYFFLRRVMELKAHTHSIENYLLGLKCAALNSNEISAKLLVIYQ